MLNTNGTTIKTKKSKLLQSLSFTQLDGTQMHSYAPIVDMGFMWQMCFPSAEDREKNNESHFTWRDYASKIFSTIMSRHIDASTITFFNDTCDIVESLN